MFEFVVMAFFIRERRGTGPEGASSPYHEPRGFGCRPGAEHGLVLPSGKLCLGDGNRPLRDLSPGGSVPGGQGLKLEQINKLAEKAAFRLFLKSLFRELPLPFFVFLHDLLAQRFGIFAVGVDIMERFSE